MERFCLRKLGLVARYGVISVLVLILFEKIILPRMRAALLHWGMLVELG